MIFQLSKTIAVSTSQADSGSVTAAMAAVIGVIDWPILDDTIAVL
jgi:hypothetical protein